MSLDSRLRGNDDKKMYHTKARRAIKKAGDLKSPAFLLFKSGLTSW